jgi:hypothetical protein
VAGASIYVVGLIGLALTIRVRFTIPTSTAWYVVSLLPRTVVAGQEARIWLRWPLFLTAVVLFATWLTSTWGGLGKGWYATFGGLLTGLVLLYGARIVVYKLPVGAVKALAYPLSPFFGPILLFLPLAVGALLMVGSAFLMDQGLLESAPENSFVLSIILLFIGAALCGVPAALTLTLRYCA